MATYFMECDCGANVVVDVGDKVYQDTQNEVLLVKTILEKRGICSHIIQLNNNSILQ